jgi:predicted nucleotide-binding protein (sugar kinase/HSP70/actin superfamily)
LGKKYPFWHPTFQPLGSFIHVAIYKSSSKKIQEK